MTAQALFSGGEHEVAPGGAVVLQLSVANLGDTTETYSLSPAGFAASWVTVRPATLTLFGGTHQTIEVEVRPPRVFTTSPGATGLTVRVVPLSAPDDVATAETRLVIGATFDRQLTILQPALRSRRKAVFEAMLENTGNSQASCRLHLVDPTGRVDADFDPPSLGVEPGANAVVRMKVRAGRLQWDRRARTIPFTVEADQAKVTAVTADATFVQAPMIPERLYPRLLAAALGMAGLAAGWFGLVRPAIDRAVDDAVADRPVATVAPDTSAVITTEPPVSSVAPSVPLVDEPEGTPFTTRLTAPAAAGATASATLEIPAGQVLKITDLVAQNPGLDEGTLIIRLGDGELLRFSLFTLSDQNIPFRENLEVSATTGLSIEVICVAAGDPANGGCIPGVVVIGQLYPI